MPTRLRPQPFAQKHTSFMLFIYKHLAPQSQINTQSSPSFMLPATKGSQISIRSWRKWFSLCVQPQSWTSVSSSNQSNFGWEQQSLKAAAYLPVCHPLSPYVKRSFTELWITTSSLLYSKQKIWKEDASYCVSSPPSCLPLSISSPSSLSCTLLPSPLFILPSLPVSPSLSLNSFLLWQRGFGSKWAQLAQMHRLIHHTGAKLQKTDRRPFFISEQFSFIPLSRRDWS